VRLLGTREGPLMLSKSGSCSSQSGPDFGFFFSTLQGLDVGTRLAVGKVSFPHSRQPSDLLGSTCYKCFLDLHVRPRSAFSSRYCVIFGVFVFFILAYCSSAPVVSQGWPHLSVITDSPIILGRHTDSPHYLKWGYALFCFFFSTSN
jgi:hypothetical protein